MNAKAAKESPDQSIDTKDYFQYPLDRCTKDTKEEL